MGILDNFEKGLERAVNGAFAKTFKSGLQPVEITSALRRELDTKAAVVSRDRILVPNTFTVRMSPNDHDRMSNIGPALIDELTSLVQKYAASQGYSFPGPLSISLRSDRSLPDGLIQIDSVNAKGTVSWSPVLDIGGKRYPITQARTVIGRGSEADVTVDDTGTSRKHVEILWDGRNGQARDLGSTNGSKLNGQPFRQAALAPDSVVEIGRTKIIFRVLPTAAGAEARSGTRVDDRTMRHNANSWGDV
ncbi:FhaA domain-containing protein [Plantibacter sp. Mn2098]|uniref:FhaA domain-containing protein n=1 Tax=Plantibacter sp. Mn2098 TaxID=3395266 RepID=UPI003BDBD35B